MNSSKNINRINTLSVLFILLGVHLLVGYIFATSQGVAVGHSFEVLLAYLLPPLWVEAPDSPGYHGFGLPSALAIVAVLVTSAAAVVRPGRLVLALAAIALMANTCLSAGILGMGV